MTDRDPTCIGYVRHVLGATVTVALGAELAGIAPIFRGHLQPIGQIGALVRMPQGMVDLIGTVSLVGIAELSPTQKPVDAVQRDERWIQVQLLGEIDRGTGKFQRGVGTYPGLDDPVHFATPHHLQSVFPQPNDQYLRLGRLAAAMEVPVCLDAAKLVVRHSAVVGSTGSGKTSAVASILQNFSSGGWQSSNIVVVDPHGEYARALGVHAAVRSVRGDGQSQLRVPYWALPAMDILKIFVGAAGATFANRFVELVATARRDFVAAANWLPLDPATISADSPVPFDIRQIWYRLDYENRETRDEKPNPQTACIEDPGDAGTLRPAVFRPYNPGGAAPHKAPSYDAYGTGPNQLRLGLIDPALRFFLEPMGTIDGPDPLVEVVQSWLGRERPISVLDFSGVPTGAADAAIGVVLNLLFELSLHSDNDIGGVGRSKPVLVVLEEAHRYLGEGASQLSKESANRIAREGRKYGLGLMLVTQRPTELPDTALAQCGTIIALRLTNAEDQSAIRGALPDTVAGLATVLPSLRTGEAVVSGEALVLPVRALLDKPNPLPRAEDPNLAAWRNPPIIPNVGPALARWRRNFEEAADD